MSLHRYWRVHILRNGGGSNVSMSNIELRETPGGADATVPGGAASASSVYGPYVAANAVDDAASTSWTSNGAPPQWFQYDFGVGVSKEINEIAITSRPDGYVNETPVEVQLRFSDDGIAWTGWKWLVAPASWTSVSQTQVLVNRTPAGLIVSRAYTLVAADRAAGIHASRAYVLVAADRAPGIHVSRAYVLVAVEKRQPLAVTGVDPNHAYDFGGARVRVTHNGGY